MSEAWEEVKGKDLLLKVLSSTKGDEARDIKKGDAILLDLVAWRCEEPPTEVLKDDDAATVFQQVKSLLVIVGEQDLVEGVDTGLLNMKEGQTAYLFCTSKFALGEGTRKYQDCEIAPNTNVVYRVSATSIVQDTSRLNPYFSIQKALTRKKIANDLYQYELLSLTAKEAADNTRNEAARMRALKLYRQAGRDMKDLLDGTYFNSVEQDHPQRKECKQLMIDCYNNVVVVYMHGKQYAKALDAVEMALKRDPKNLKALIRNAKLHVLLASSEKKLKEADEALSMAENAISYRDQAEEAELKKIRLQYKQRRKQVLGQ
ncbi:Peptidyl-prolyl cis-trans isomerase [Seminavis robusta]|uniref:peptidylprolyl isomerase n=1 Tax=Seminavis robusta TaxID=568900 RepID=A0A9N8DG38_9STRA|nr:Peptidyl-prolyl cis-trans isomerase [Seminavis robusta]|eukprot:Sro71_g039540.1 Peptidyl-prolyl cis-trans isomerase (317) ;mRNA; r:109806-110857